MLDDPAIPGLIMFCCYDSRSMPLHMLSARRSVIKREARQPFWRSIDAFFSGAGQAECLPPIAYPAGKVARRLEQYWNTKRLRLVYWCFLGEARTGKWNVLRFALRYRR